MHATAAPELEPLESETPPPEKAPRSENRLAFAWAPPHPASSDEAREVEAILIALGWPGSPDSSLERVPTHCGQDLQDA